MDPDRLNRWLTLGANIGVLIGIALLMVELNQNRDMMRAQTRHDLAMGIVELQHSAAESKELAEIMRKGAVGEELSPTEDMQNRLRLNALLRYWEDVHYQFRLGLYDETEYSRHREAIRRSFQENQSLVDHWCRTRPGYSADFASEMATLLRVDSC